MNARTLFGWLLILTGAFLFVETTGLADIPYLPLIFDWRSIMLIVAVISVLGNMRDFGNWVFLYFGGILNLPRVTDWDFFQLLSWTFPALIILYGLTLLLGQPGRRKRHNTIPSLDLSALPRNFSFSHRRIKAGGKARDLDLNFTASSVEIDLSEVKVSGATNWTIRSSAVMSSLTYILPPSCRVLSSDTNLFGGSHTVQNIVIQEPDADGQVCTLTFLNFNLFSKTDILPK